jgi:hypothetical protein
VMNRVVNRNSAQSVSNCTVHAVYLIFFVCGEGGSFLDFFRSQCVPIKFIHLMYTTNSCPSNINQLLSHGLQDETSKDLGVIRFSQGDPEFWASNWSLVDFQCFKFWDLSAIVFLCSKPSLILAPTSCNLPLFRSSRLICYIPLMCLSNV